MSSRGRRYDGGEPKLNIKKVLAVIVAIIVMIMVVILIQNFLKQGSEKGKITSQSYYASFKDNKWGVIDSNGNDVIDPSYKEIITVPNNKKDVFICTYDVDYNTSTYKTKALNSKNEEIFTEYSNIQAIENTDENGTMWYEENVLKVEKDGKYGLIDLSGKQLLANEYDEINPILGIQNAFKIKKDNKCGIANNEGTIIIKPEYIDITNIGKDNKQGYIIKSDNEKYGVVDYSDKQVLEPKYDEIKQITGCNLYVVTESGKQKIINKTGKDIVTKGFDEIISISENTGDTSGIIFKKSEKYGFMNLSGEILIEAKYDKLIQAAQGYLIVKEDGKYGVIDTKENIKIDYKYSTITYSKEADIYIAEDEKYNSQIYNTDFEVKLTGMFITIDTSKDYIKMRISGDYKYYNFKFEEKNVSEILTSNTIFLSKQNGKYGFVDKTGKVLVDYQYDDATEQNECGYAAIKKDGKWGSVDSKGNVTQEPTYNLENYLEINFIGRWHKGIDPNINSYTQE